MPEHEVKMRDLHDIIRDMAHHTTTHPTHGLNCACKDEYLREARVMLLPNMVKELSYLVRVLERT